MDESININMYNNDLFMNKFSDLKDNIEDIEIEEKLLEKLKEYDKANTFVTDMAIEVGSQLKYN